MTNLSINPHHSSTSRNGVNFGTGRGLYCGNPPNVQNTIDAAQVPRDQEIVQLNRTIQQMKNKIIILRRRDDYNSRNTSSP
jgi:hypothetical protein